MIDKWFIQDIEKLTKRRKRVVVVDPTASCEFLIKIAEKEGYTVLRTDKNLTEEWQRVKEELFLRYEAETRHKEESVIFYATREKNKLSFLFDYCFTHGCIDFTRPAEWIKERLFTHTGLQITMDSSSLLTAAKLSIGKNIDWWKKILQNLEDLVSLEEELVPFLSNPVGYFKNKDADVKRLFEEKLFELIGQPYTNKPAKTLAKEVVNLLFEELLNNDVNPQLLSVYHKWLDSNTYADALQGYVDNYKIDKTVNVWNVHPDHCFTEIDKKQLEEIVDNFRNHSFVEEKLQKIKPRLKSRWAKRFVPGWWEDVITLFEFDTKPLNSCNALNKVVEFYTSSFHRADRAIRKLYVHFINEEKIIRPLQEHYESLNSELLAHWYEYSNEYKSNQPGYLVELLKEAKPRTAVIVGDGLRYEIAEFIAEQLSKHSRVERAVMLAGVPSETEHNMSALYVGEGEIIKLHSDREKKLSELTGKEIVFLNIEELNYGADADYLVLTYKDIDSAGEKLQMGALKLFEEFENVLSKKIQLLIKKGYEVHLVTDHGFVLTGLLDEADKIEPDAAGKKEVHERFIRTVEKQTKTDWIEFKEKYGEYNYVYVAKNYRPFKSKGVYGFAHGGFTPQEIIIPNFVFVKERETVEGLKVVIQNKEELREVVGENFALKIEAIGDSDNLFATARKVQALLFADNIKFSESNITEIGVGEKISFEFSFAGNSKIRAIVIDYETREQLNAVDIKKSTARDLDGLL